jgi:hypothetical protein
MWIATDTDVACTLQVTDTRLNVTRTYSLLAMFPAFPAITVDGWHKMKMPQRMERINAFKAYVNELEDIEVDAIQTNDVFRPAGETPGVSPSDWILATGSWDDNGYWKDTAAWPI